MRAERASRSDPQSCSGPKTAVTSLSIRRHSTSGSPTQSARRADSMSIGSVRGVWWSAVILVAGTAAAAPPAPETTRTPPVPSPPSTVAAKKPALPSAPVPWPAAVSKGPIHFATDVVPILTKAGCNQGSCHGAQSRKGGFKQSLRGWDPAFDWEQIVKDANGQRINKAHPEKSLVFLKPTAQHSQDGGQRFTPDSYRQRAAP